MVWFLTVLYGFPALVAVLNLLLMKRPIPAEPTPARFCVLIPARNEAENLRRLLPHLAGIDVYVFDDESSDGTGEVARKLGAKVITGRPLPEGWTGKNRACHELAKAATEDAPDTCFLFLDADVVPKTNFVSNVNGMIAQSRTPVITGFLDMDAGTPMGSIYLSWVPWILLCTNPFGLVQLTGFGHNGFTNGQFVLWRGTAYADVWPHEAVKGRVLEDVAIGRLLAKRKMKVEVMNLAHVAKVHMYKNFREALDGMSKNSFEITGSVVGSLFMALLFFMLSTAWLFGLPYAVFTLMAMVMAATCVALISGLTGGFLTPVTLFLGGVTFLRSLWWKLSGRITWKGRQYS